MRWNKQPRDQLGYYFPLRQNLGEGNNQPLNKEEWEENIFGNNIEEDIQKEIQWQLGNNHEENLGDHNGENPPLDRTF